MDREGAAYCGVPRPGVGRDVSVPMDGGGADRFDHLRHDLDGRARSNVEPTAELPELAIEGLEVVEEEIRPPAPRSEQRWVEHEQGDDFVVAFGGIRPGRVVGEAEVPSEPDDAGHGQRVPKKKSSLVSARIAASST